MAVSTIAFNGFLDTPSFGEGQCELTFVPPSNIAGKLCYVKSTGFTFSSSSYTGKQAWHTFILSNDWAQPQCAHVDYNPQYTDTASFTANRTGGSAVLTNVYPGYNLNVGMEIRNSEIPGGGIAYITSIDSNSQITLDRSAGTTTANGVQYYGVVPKSQTQYPKAPLAVFNDYGPQPVTTLCFIPNGPHTIKFKVSRFDKGIITQSIWGRSLAFSVVFEIVAANSRQPPIN